MAVSGSTDFTLTTSTLIEEAYAHLKMGFEGEDISPEMSAEAKRSLNMMLADWQNDGIHLWTFEDATLFLQAGKTSYVLENSNFTTSFTKTALTNDAVTGATTIVLDGVSGLLIDDNIGIMDNDSNLFWTTVRQLSGTTVTLTDALINDSNAACPVFYYTTTAPDVERVLGVRRTSNFEDDTPINFVSRQEYFDLPNKSQVAQNVSEAYYHRKNPNGELFLWQTPQNSLELVKVRYERKMFDFVNNDDTPDVPKGFYLAMALNLAEILAVKYGVSEPQFQRVRYLADKYLTNALNFDNEVYNIKVSLHREARV